MLLQYTSYILKNAKVCCCRWRTLKRNSKLPCLPRNSQPFMTPLIIRMTLHPLQCKCQVSTIAFQLCCTSGLSTNKTLKIFKTLGVLLSVDLMYRTRAIITRGLYTFYPLFEVHLCTVTFGPMYG